MLENVKSKRKKPGAMVRVDADCHAQLKVLCAESAQTMKGLLRKLVAEYARRQGREAA